MVKGNKIAFDGVARFAEHHEIVFGGGLENIGLWARTDKTSETRQQRDLKRSIWNIPVNCSITNIRCLVLAIILLEEIR